jgi:hypothetical protein
MISNLQRLNWRKIYLTFVALVLLVPALMMPFSREVLWAPGDFAAAALLLGGAWAAVELVVGLVTSRVGRAALTATVIFAALATWAHLAVQF